MFRTIFTLLATLYSVSTLANYQSYFSPEDKLIPVVYQELEKAKTSIDISIYSFRNEEIKSVLLQKAAQGLKIRIVINNGTKTSVKSFSQELSDQGVDIRYVNKINHHKFLILDSKILLNSSANLTGNALAQSYDENMVVCDDCDQRVSLYQKEFNHLHRFGMPVNDSYAILFPEAPEARTVHSESELALFTSDNFMPYIRKDSISFRAQTRSDRLEGAVDSKLIDAISHAQDHIQIATGHFRSKPLYDAVVDAIDRGIKVDIVLDGQEYISFSAQKKENQKVEKCMNEKNSEIKCYKTGLHFGRLLAYAGANVRFKYYMLRWYFPMAPQMHHKYMIIDEKALYSGSYNWSYNAEFKSFENVGIYHETTLIEDYQNNFQLVASYGEGDQGFNELIDEYESAESTIETTFEPVSLTYKQIDSLRRLAYNKCQTLYTNSNSNSKCSF